MLKVLDLVELHAILIIMEILNIGNADNVVKNVSNVLIILVIHAIIAHLGSSNQDFLAFKLINAQQKLLQTMLHKNVPLVQLNVKVVLIHLTVSLV